MTDQALLEQKPAQIREMPLPVDIQAAFTSRFFGYLATSASR
jgi:hypothetical protein